MFFIILLAMFSSPGTDASSSLITFQPGTLCDLQRRLDNRCSWKVHESQSRDNISMLDCARQCTEHKTCIGASMDTDSKTCYMHETCTPSIPCTIVETKHEFYHYPTFAASSKECVRGKWNERGNSSSSECSPGTYGDRCENVIKNCVDAYEEANGHYHHWSYIDPEQNRNVFWVRCRMPTKRNKSSISLFYNSANRNHFNKTYQEYIDGFEIDGTNFWIGLEALHVLTHSGCSKVTFVLAFDDTNDETVHRVYDGFVVGKVNEGARCKYTFTYSSSTAKARGNVPKNFSFEDCLSSVKNVPFSTWDYENNNNNNNNDNNNKNDSKNDNDDDKNPEGSGENCASRVGNGWWHPSGCNLSCNFLGWGLDDWDNVPAIQRLNVGGVDMDAAHSRVTKIFAYIDC